MRVCSQKDATQLSLILSDPNIYKHCSDDGLGRAQVKKHVKGLLANPANTILIPANGVIMTFVRQNTIMYLLHIVITPRCQLTYKERIKAAREAVRFMAERGARKFVAQVPKGNRAARLIAVATGLKPCGCLKESFQKSGEFIDLMVYESELQEVLSLIKER